MSTTNGAPATIRQMEAERSALLKELEVGQAEYRSGKVTQARATDLQQKAKEVEDLDEHIKQYNRIAGIVSDSRKIDSPILPDGSHKQRAKIVTTPGHLFVASDAFRQYRSQSKQGWSAKVDVKNIRGDRVTLRGDDADQFQVKAYDAATLSDLGDDAIIRSDTDSDLVRYEEPEILTMRDILNVVPTTSDSVRFVRHTETDRAAASQEGRGGEKSYLTVTFDAVSVQVETIAVLSKVTEQDIDDAPRLVGIVNTEMRYDVRNEEERQLLWGDGNSNALEGLFEQGVEQYEFDRAALDDTVIDLIRRMRTNLRKRRIVPTAVMIDPLDWETVELTKGDDEHYVWGVIQTLRGPQIWSLRVVESDAMTHPTTGARRILMGDFRRGATLYDRHDVRLAVGFVDDDFARNLRTLRAEQRLALGVKRPHAFEWSETAEAAT
jgi:HK97 family phage major capsid protein